jgi:hypothetical protein
MRVLLINVRTARFASVAQRFTRRVLLRNLRDNIISMWLGVKTESSEELSRVSLDLYAVASLPYVFDVLLSFLRLTIRGFLGWKNDGFLLRGFRWAPLSEGRRRPNNSVSLSNFGCVTSSANTIPFVEGG